MKFEFLIKSFSLLKNKSFKCFKLILIINYNNEMK